MSTISVTSPKVATNAIPAISRNGVGIFQLNPTPDATAKPVAESVGSELGPSPAVNNFFSASNMSRMRLSQDFEVLAPVKPVISAIEIRRPNKQEFIRTRPGKEWQFGTLLFLDAASGEYYLVTPEMHAELSSNLTSVRLVLTMPLYGFVPFLWPQKLTLNGGRQNSWNQSATEVGARAESEWLRIESDGAADRYVPFIALGEFPEPTWPEELSTIFEYLELAFSGRTIENRSHPCLRRLRGEI